MGRIIVIGAALPGLAAALRLAKVGHDVCLIEKSDAVGGRWARPESWPASLAVPAAWRDLFRKTGRTLEAELASRKLSLSPVPAPIYELAHRTTLPFPSDRATQYAVLRTTFSSSVADAWQAQVDSADDAWQLLRRLGLESDEKCTWRMWRALQPRHTMREVLDDLGEAGDLARPLTWPYDPADVPAWVMASMAADRALGRVHIVDEQLRPHSSSLLVELLRERLATRGVELRTAQVSARTRSSVRLADETLSADAVIDTTGPWSGLSAAPRNIVPARVPQVFVTEGGSEGPELVNLAASTRQYCTVVGDQWHIVTWDYTAPVDDASMGVAWQGAPSWRRRPAGVDRRGVFRAHAANRAGSEPWAQILSGALAAYAAHLKLTGTSIHPIDDPRKRR